MRASGNPAFLRRAVIANCLLGSIQRFCVPGPVLQLIAVSLFGVTAVQYSYVATVFAFLSFFQLAGLYFQYRSDAYRPLIISYDVRIVALLLCGASFLLAPDATPAAALLFFAAAAAINICHMTGFNVSWPLIMRAWTTAEDRGTTIATLRSVQAAFAALIALAISVLGSSGHFRTFLIALFVVFALYSFFSARQVAWMKETGPPLTRTSGTGGVFVALRQDFRTLWNDPTYRALAFIVAVASFSLIPLQVFFLRDVMSIGEDKLFWFVTSMVWAGIAATQAWGRLSDKLGTPRTLQLTAAANVVAVLAICLIVSWWLFTGEHPSVLAWIAATALLASSISFQGFSIGWYSAALEVIPKDCTSLGVLLLSILTEFAIAASAFVVGFIREWSTSSVPVRELSIAAILLAVALVTYAATAAWTLSRRRATTTQAVA